MTNNTPHAHTESGVRDVVSDASHTTYLTVEEAAERFQVKPSTVYEWVRGGRLPCYRLGPRAIRFTPKLLDRFADETFDPGRVSV